MKTKKQLEAERKANVALWKKVEETKSQKETLDVSKLLLFKMLKTLERIEKILKTKAYLNHGVNHNPKALKTAGYVSPEQQEEYQELMSKPSEFQNWFRVLDISRQGRRRSYFIRKNKKKLVISIILM